MEHPKRVNELILIDAAGMPNKLPLSGKMVKMFPAIGRLMYGMNVDMMRKQGLSDFFVHDKKLLTQTYFENVTRFHTVKETTDVMLDIMQCGFFIHSMKKFSN